MEEAAVNLTRRRIYGQIRKIHNWLLNVAKFHPTQSKMNPDWYDNAYDEDGDLSLTSLSAIVKCLGLNPIACGLNEDASDEQLFRWFVVKHLFQDTKSFGMDYEYYLMSLINLDHRLARTTGSHLVSGDYFDALSSIMHYKNIRLEWDALDNEKGQLTLVNAKLVGVGEEATFQDVSELSDPLIRSCHILYLVVSHSLLFLFQSIVTLTLTMKMPCNSIVLKDGVDYYRKRQVYDFYHLQCFLLIYMFS